MKTPRLLRPLAPSTYLLRNYGKTLPLVGVITMAVLLVAGIISLIDSIPYSIRTIYAYNREFLGVTPRGDPAETPKIIATIRKESPVPIERILVCRGIGTQVKSIVGDWPFIVLGMNQSDLVWYLHRQHAQSWTGRIPKPGAPEAIVSRTVAKNLRLHIGSVLLGPYKTDSYSPMNVKVVGIADTDRWVMLTSVEYIREYHFPPIDSAIVCAPDLRQQSVLDAWAAERFKGSRAQMWEYRDIEKRSNTMFETLYKILNVVIGTIVLVITFMMGMLMNIYQSQRLVEFGLLQAIGYTNKQLLRRVSLEAATVILLGWAIGLLLAYWLLRLADFILMQPNAYALDPWDRTAYLYTIPAPIAILTVAIATVFIRFRRFDPIGVIERRVV